MYNITPCLWFDNEAEEAAKFYVSVFQNGKIISTAKYTVDTPSKKRIGSVMTVEFELRGQPFLALNGGPEFKFNEAVSFIIACKDQAEIDYFYDKLSAVPEAEICGWIKDKYGVSWQLVTEDWAEIMSGPNSSKVMEELLKMKRIVVDTLKEIARRR